MHDEPGCVSPRGLRLGYTSHTRLGSAVFWLSEPKASFFMLAELGSVQRYKVRGCVRQKGYCEK